MIKMKNANLRNMPVRSELVQSTSNHIDQDLDLLCIPRTPLCNIFQQFLSSGIETHISKNGVTFQHNMTLNSHNYLFRVIVLKHPYLRSFYLCNCLLHQFISL
jgi:hypothetical protein